MSFSRNLSAGYPVVTPFATRAALKTFTALRVYAVGVVVSAAGVQYQYDGTSTAISDMPGWKPFGNWQLEHFGVAGATATTLATDTTPPAGATVDEASLIQAAFDAALAAGEDLYGDPTKVYGISSGVVWGLRNNTLSIKGNPTLIDVAMQVVGGTWTAGNLSNADPTLWTFGTAALTVGKTSGYTGSGKPRLSTLGVSVNANRLARVGIHFRGVSQSNHDASAYRALEAQLLVGAAPGGDDTLNCTDAKFTLRGSEFQYSTDLADGYNDWTVRTAVGLMVQSSDVSFHQVTIAPSKYGVVIGTGYNIQFTNCKFWNGPARTNSNSRTLWVSLGANNWTFSACRFDDGHLYLQSFNGALVGCFQIQYSFSNAVTLEASAAGETASDFAAIGNAFQYTSANLTTSGSGSWGTFGGRVSANRNTNNNSFTFGGYGLRAATARLTGTTEMSGDVLLSQTANNSAAINADRGIRLMADYDNNSGGTQSVVEIGSGGTVFHQMQEAGNLLFGYLQATGGGSIANFTWSGAKFQISPSDGAGGTSFGNRLEYDPAAGWATYGTFRPQGTVTLIDNNTTIIDDADATKAFKFQASGITTGNTRVITIPDASCVLASRNSPETFTAAKGFSGGLSVTGSTPYGYGAGVGGAVTQATSRTTGVTLNKLTGKITLVSDPGAVAGQRFTVTNSTVTADSVVTINVVKGSTNIYAVMAEPADAGGSFDVTIIKISGGATEAPVLKFAVQQAQVA